MSNISFTKKIIGKVNDNEDHVVFNAMCTVGDINNDGFKDIVISGFTGGKAVWFENPAGNGQWKQHIIDDVNDMECGGILYDLTGNGFQDLINGNAMGKGIYWWENPGIPDVKWKKRLVARAVNRCFHDIAIGNVTDDGKVSLIFTNQFGPEGTSICRVPIPEDAAVSPWPGVEIIARDKKELNPFAYDPMKAMQPEEGLAIGDMDNDGKNEIVCGTHWYKFTGDVGHPWEEHKFAGGYITTKVAIADVDNDGKNEIILSEGDPVIYGDGLGKLAWFKPAKDIRGMWQEHIIDEGFLDAHSLKTGDLFGNGRQDIFTGEIGKADKNGQYAVRPPRLLIYENNGDGSFTRHLIDEGTGTHEAVLADMRNAGVLDIVGKPLHGPEKWNVHVWYNNNLTKGWKAL